MSKTKLSLLIIEDDVVDQLAFKRFIKKSNISYDYEVVSSLTEAKKIISSQHFDAIITDFNLGDGTAFELLEMKPKSPVVFITGAGNEEVAVRAMKSGAADYLVKDNEGNYLKILPVTIERVIKHKKAEEQCKILSQALTSISDSVYVTDVNNEIIFVNKSFTVTYGYTEDEIIGKNFDILWEHDHDQGNMLDTFSTSEIEFWIDEFFHIKKDGSRFPVSLSQSPVFDDSGSLVGIVWVARDITEKKRAEKEKEKLISDLKEALSKVKTLKGLIPICACCKRIRDDKGYWNQIETYIKEHSDADFSHGLCPECAEKLYPEFMNKKRKNKL